MHSQDEDSEFTLASDFEIGHFFRERIVPRAVLYFTGEAIEDDDNVRTALSASGEPLSIDGRGPLAQSGVFAALLKGSLLVVLATVQSQESDLG